MEPLGLLGLAEPTHPVCLVGMHVGMGHAADGNSPGASLFLKAPPAFSSARPCKVRLSSRALLRLCPCRLRCIQRAVWGPSTSTQGSTCLACRLHSCESSACALG